MSRPSKNKRKVAAASKARRIKKCRLDNDIFSESECGFDVNEDDGQTTSEVHINAITKLMEASKIWLKNRRPLTYTSNSRTTRWQRKISSTYAALHTPTLETFLKNNDREEIPTNVLSTIELPENYKIESEEDIQEDNSLKEDIDKPSSPVLKLRLQAMLQYLNLLDKKWTKMKATKAVSDALSQKPHYAKNLHAWTNNYIKFHTIPITRRGLHVKTITFLWDEDIFEVSSKILAKYINDEILPSLGFDPPPTIHENTARNYLIALGYEFSRVKKGV
ncbi:12495_t:CDS:2, partial [Dentiscutata erythropus]